MKAQKRQKKTNELHEAFQNYKKIGADIGQLEEKEGELLDKLSKLVHE